MAPRGVVAQRVLGEQITARAPGPRAAAAAQARELARAAAPAEQNRYQLRFHALVPWSGAISCARPERFRWGKARQSEARTARAVPLALDLPRLSRDAALLRGALLTPLPELGLEKAEPPEPAAARQAPPSPRSAHRAPERSSCGASKRELAPARRPVAVLAVALIALAVLASRRRAARPGGP